jgi:hypothetical protein
MRTLGCTAVACLALCTACGHQMLLPGRENQSAARYAHVESEAMDDLRVTAPLALRLCRIEAAYAYFHERSGVGAGPLAPLPRARLWSVYYATAKAEHESIAWSELCEELDATGVAVNRAALSLRAYASAIDGVAEGRPLDASGIQNASNGVNTVLGAVQASSPVAAAARDVGSSLVGLATPLVQGIEERKLHAVVARAHPGVHALVTNLLRYFEALEELLHNAEEQKKNTDAYVDKFRRGSDGALLADADLVNAYELASDLEDDFIKIAVKLRRCRDVLAAIDAADDALARDAAKDIDATLKTLEAKTKALESGTLPVLADLPASGKDE